MSMMAGPSAARKAPSPESLVAATPRRNFLGSGKVICLVSLVENVCGLHPRLRTWDLQLDRGVTAVSWAPTEPCRPQPSTARRPVSVAESGAAHQREDLLVEPVQALV